CSAPDSSSGSSDPDESHYAPPQAAPGGPNPYAAPPQQPPAAPAAPAAPVPADLNKPEDPR
ncbi:hypothetical protein, partial [Streptomyces sp. NPDC000188]|uniref:hypothetical protein n=1 Tax=Streptomyces sp. NPDC000188 TaxID=3154245 RepID=UPI00332D8E12